MISSLFIDEIIPHNDQVLTCSAIAVDLDEEIQVQFSWEINGDEYQGATIDLSTISVLPMESVTYVVPMSSMNMVKVMKSLVLLSLAIDNQQCLW